RMPPGNKAGGRVIGKTTLPADAISDAYAFLKSRHHGQSGIIWTHGGKNKKSRMFIAGSSVAPGSSSVQNGSHSAYRLVSCFPSLVWDHFRKAAVASHSILEMEE